MGTLRRSARISKLDRKTDVYIREKINAQDTILNEITRKKETHFLWSCRENGPNAITKNYDRREKEKNETVSPKNLERWKICSRE